MKPGKLQRSQDSCWKVHNHTQTFHPHRLCVCMDNTYTCTTKQNTPVLMYSYSDRSKKNINQSFVPGQGQNNTNQNKEQRALSKFITHFSLVATCIL